MWVLEKIVEQIAQDSLRWLVNQFGTAGKVTLFLTVGLSLVLGGPLYMSRDNRRRKSAERKPRYSWIEYVIVVLGGIVFTATGVYLLTNPG